MSEKQPKSKSEHTIAKRALATGLATLAFGAGIATGAESKAQETEPKTEMAKSPTWSPEQTRNALIKQRANEQKTFASYGKLKQTLPGTIHSTLKQNYPNTAGFLPGETIKYVLPVVNPRHGTTTIRASYVKGDLHTLTIAQNQIDPFTFESLENLEYTQIAKSGKGYRINKQFAPTPPKNGLNIITSVFRSPIPSYAEMPNLELPDRRAVTTEFKAAQMEVQVALNDLAQFGLYKQTVS